MCSSISQNENKCIEKQDECFYNHIHKTPLNVNAFYLFQQKHKKKLLKCSIKLIEILTVSNRKTYTISTSVSEKVKSISYEIQPIKVFLLNYQ